MKRAAVAWAQRLAAALQHSDADAFVCTYDEMLQSGQVDDLDGVKELARRVADGEELDTDAVDSTSLVESMGVTKDATCAHPPEISGAPPKKMPLFLLACSLAEAARQRCGDPAAEPAQAHDATDPAAEDKSQICVHAKQGHPLASPGLRQRVGMDEKRAAVVALIASRWREACAIAASDGKVPGPHRTGDKETHGVVQAPSRGQNGRRHGRRHARGYRKR